MTVIKRYIEGEWVPIIVGREGIPATVDVGTVTELNPDQPPAVSNSGSSAAAVFDFDLPGAPSFAVGTVTQVDPGDPVAVTDVGENGNIVLDFDLPKGDKGDTGDTGDTGPAGIVQSESEPADTNALWLDQSLTGAGYSVYMGDILDVDYGSAEPALNDVLVWDGYNWIPDSRVAVLG